MRTLLDKLGRPLRDLRISVTDRCNFRCTYCMPKEIFGKDFPYLEKSPHNDLEEIDRLVEIFTRLGVKKVRLTGGAAIEKEPLGTSLNAFDPDLEIALTTNGVLLPRYAPALSAAGLDRVTVSLDAIDEGTFASITDSGHTVAAVLAGIEAAESVGLGPIKINTVVKRNVNENEILDLISRFSSRDIAVRFIEYMDVGSTNGWKMDDVVPAREILQIVGPVKSIEPSSPSDVAKMYRMEGGGQVGVISSVTEPFCGSCSRARISADGRLFPCLFSNSGLDLLSPLRQGAEDEFLEEEISRFWTSRTDRYSEVRTDSNNNGNKIEMSYIGGWILTSGTVFV